MRILYQWIVARPRACLLLVGALVVLGSLGLPRLQLDASLNDLYSSSDPEVAFFADVEANFGSEAYLSAILRSEDVTSPGVAAEARALESEFAKIAAVDRVVGYSQVRSLRMGWGSGPGSPDGGGEVETRLANAAGPLIGEFLVNPGGNALAIHLVLENDSNLVEQANALSEMRRILRDRLGDPPGSGIRYYVIGTPTIINELTRQMEQDLALLGPVALVIIGVILLLAFRSVLGAIIPLATGILSVVTALGFMGFLGISLNPLASTIVLLILVIGCTEDIHFLSEFASSIRAGKSREAALRSLDGPVVDALFLTSLTTVVGFLSIAPVAVSGLREFAFACALGISVNFVITILLVPSILRYARVESLGRMRSHLDSEVAERVARLVARHPVRITVAATAFVAVFVVGMFRTEIETDYLRFLPKDSPVAKSYWSFDEDFGGTRFFLVVVETGKKDGVFLPETIEALGRLDEFLESRMESAVGIVDLLAAAGGEDRRSEIDVAREALRRAGIPPFVDHDGSRTVIRVRSNAPGTREMRRGEEEILEFARTSLPDSLDVRLSGEEILITRFSDRVTTHLIQNMLLLAGICGILLSLFFRSLRTGLLSLVPNLVPLVAVFGVMGWAGIPLGTGTFAVAIVALGIAVDDSIHLVSRFRAESGEGKSFEATLVRTWKHELRPVSVTSVSLTLGFLVLLVSSLPVHRESGLLFATAIASAFFADLFITPLLLRGMQGARGAG